MAEGVGETDVVTSIESDDAGGGKGVAENWGVGVISGVGDVCSGSDDAVTDAVGVGLAEGDFAGVADGDLPGVGVGVGVDDLRGVALTDFAFGFGVGVGVGEGVCLGRSAPICKPRPNPT